MRKSAKQADTVGGHWH